MQSIAFHKSAAVSGEEFSEKHADSSHEHTELRRRGWGSSVQGEAGLGWARWAWDSSSGSAVGERVACAAVWFGVRGTGRPPCSGRVKLRDQLW